MKDSYFVEDFCSFIAKEPRDPLSSHKDSSLNFLLNLLKDKALPSVEKFDVDYLFYEAVIYFDNKSSSCKLFNSILKEFSPEINGKAFLVNARTLERLKVIDFIPIVSYEDFNRSKSFYKRLNLKALILFTEKSNFVRSEFCKIIYPILFIENNLVKELDGKELTINIKSSHKKLTGQNIYWEIGRGPIVYLLSNIDTERNSCGAVYNASSLCVMLMLFFSLFERYNCAYKFRFLITDYSNYDFIGAKKHLSNVKNKKFIYHVISLDGLGWQNSCVVYKDINGENGEFLNEIFYKHLIDMNLSIPFVMRDKAFDHIVFKDNNKSSLYLSSLDDYLKNSEEDNLNSLNKENILKWYEILNSFVRRMHAI